MNTHSLLSDVTVIDFTRYLSGPFATQILADLGARVIKVERSDYDPRVDSVASRIPALHTSRNKLSIALDMKSRAGVAVALRLAEKADIVFENARPGVMAKIGLDFSRLRAINPDIVVCSISGFGQDGPYRDRPAYDLIAQALSGAISITGEPGRDPVQNGVPVADVSAGIFAAAGALAALHRARQTGIGEFIDIAMLDVVVSMLGYMIPLYLTSGVVPGPRGIGLVGNPLWHSYRCRDGTLIVIAISGADQAAFKRLCEQLDRPEWIDDPEFCTEVDRRRNEARIVEALGTIFATQDAEEWIRRLSNADVPAAPIQTFDRVVADPQLQHRGMLVETEYEKTKLPLVGNPIKVLGVQDSYSPPPRHGEHSVAVLRDYLGATQSEIDRLLADGVVRGPAPQDTGALG